jgi:hypothetical protein
MTDIFVAKVLVFGPRKTTPKLNFIASGVWQDNLDLKLCLT